MSNLSPALQKLLKILLIVLLAAVVVVFCRFLFRPLLPLALAFVLSGLISRPVEYLCRKLPVPRGACALFVTLVLLALTIVSGWALWRLAADQLGTLLLQLPALTERLQNALMALQHKLERQIPNGGQLPAILSPQRWLAGLQPPSVDIHALAESLGWAASSLPDLLLTAVFILAATVFLTGQRQEILGFLSRQMPPKLLETLTRLRQDLSATLLGWCKAQGILAAVTCALLLAGFLFLRVQAAFLLAVVIALLDTLPVIGAGLFLLPWALVELLLGYSARGLGLALLYAAIVAVRNLLEPHVLGRQIGLHPFVSLISVYYGWRLAGVTGMIAAPCFVLILVKLQDWGYSNWWR